ncbi:hypothetical protein BP6252_04221 [Coleophoma cylindrospora]|uniref:Uncharacterized protein n=1 Tax=Coleophoma cylindrospora TaxID=1849047 RepID=A0A3D8RZV4_9HELO|nr:hypothetical protein BP6252_04221 [Coleophoma cylindrospora]
MAIISPVYAIILPCLFLFTIPVAIFASLTSVLAFAVLAFRVTLIYIELAVAVIPYYLFGDKGPTVPLPRSKSFIDPVTRVRRRKRRSSSSNQSAGTITPTLGDAGFGISQSIGPTRDYEGVGGWRLDNPSDDEGLWTSFHVQLELPADHGRRHRRSQTSGSAPLVRKMNRSSSPEALTMHSPNTSRTRTSPTVMMSNTSYFPTQPLSPRIAKKPPSLNTCTSASSESSRSSGLNMKKV